MAYVANSDSLRNDIKSRLQALANAELNTVLPADDYLEKKIAEDAAFKLLVQTAFINKLWEGKEDIRAIAGDRLNNPSFSGSLQLYLVFADGTKMPRYVAFPIAQGTVPSFALSGRSGSYIEPPSVTINSPETMHPYFVEAQASAAARKECEDRWNKVRTQVIDFVQKCKSLNEALKLWPDLAKYVPDEYIERVNKKAERSKPAESDAAKALAAMDMDAVAASVTLARMAGAKL